MKKLFAALFLLCLSPALACTPAQSAKAAQAAARAAVAQRLGVAAFVYQFAYSNVTHDVQMGTPSIRGNAATVQGTLTIRAVEKKTGKLANGTYKGTVTLGKVGACKWRVTGYKQTG